MSVWKDTSPPLVVSLVTSYHTYDGQAQVNASPKTWWTPTSYEPARLMIAIKPESDTAANIEATGLFALHLPPNGVPELTRRVLHTAKPLPYGENELKDVGLEWEWVTHPDPAFSTVRFASILGMPFFGCMVATKMVSGDHTVYEAQVVMAGVDEREATVESVLLHRGQNRFAYMGDDYEVERY